MIDPAAAKRLMMVGASDLDVSTRRTIAAGRWADGRQHGDAPRLAGGKC
jgi:hypothetical protein